jgi:hypothetical protein
LNKDPIKMKKIKEDDDDYGDDDNGDDFTP